ncbi:MAG: hypothetical protein FWD99_06215 [Oscillospiraceae bacterium]|nr:hypothetical protein [Oscillospiraceae bacterium]
MFKSKKTIEALKGQLEQMQGSLQKANEERDGLLKTVRYFGDTVAQLTSAEEAQSQKSFKYLATLLKQEKELLDLKHPPKE